MPQKIELKVEAYEKDEQNMLKQEIVSGVYSGIGHARFGLVLGRAQLYATANGKTFLINIDELLKNVLEVSSEKTN